MNKPALVYLKDLQKNLNDLIEEHENKLEYIEPESFKDDINENILGKISDVLYEIETIISDLNDGYYSDKDLNNDDDLDELFAISGTTAGKKDLTVIFGKEDPTNGGTIDVATLKTKESDKINVAFNELQSGYTEYNTKITALKNDISGKTVQEVTFSVSTSTSEVADDNYNFYLGIRRGHSILKHFLNVLNSSFNVFTLDSISSTMKYAFNSSFNSTILCSINVTSEFSLFLFKINSLEPAYILSIPQIKPNINPVVI